MVKAIDMDEYYRIPADNRDLNYNKFFEDGEEVITQSSEYHSHNTRRLDKDELKVMLSKLKEIQSDIKEFN
jgi:UDP-N-acetylglucosamine 4,6-dehydratase/5-epimerase